MGIVLKDKYSNLATTNNILVVGNGSDLALGFATGYADFLRYLFSLCWFSFYQSLAEFYLEGEKKGSFRLSETLHDLFMDKTWQDLADELLEPNNTNNGDISWKSHRTEIILRAAKRQLNEIQQNLEEKERKSSAFYNYFNIGENYFLDDFLQMILAHCQGQVRYDGFYNLFNLKLVEYFGWILIIQGKYTGELKVSEIRDKLPNLSITVETLAEGFKSEYKSFIRLLEEANSYLHGWLDVERFIEYLVTQSNVLENKFYSSLKIDLKPKLLSSSRSIKSEDIKTHEDIAKLYQSGIDRFNELFADFLRQQQESFGLSSDSYSGLHLYYLESARKRSHGVIENFNLLDDISAVLDFNYTQSTDQIFSGRKYAPSIFHLHGSIRERNIIFGYTRAKCTETESFCYPFEKKVLKVVKDASSPDLSTLTNKNFNLIVFGHSLSPADGYVLSKLFTSPNLNTALILCYTRDTLTECYTNLISMLGDEDMERLMAETVEDKSKSDTEPNKRRLYFAVYGEGGLKDFKNK